MKIEGKFEKLEKLEELEKRISRLEDFAYEISVVANSNRELIANAFEELGHKIKSLECNFNKEEP